MRGRLSALAGAILAAAAGCDETPPPTPPATSPTGAEARVIALSPPDGGQGVSLRPRFRWRLPSHLGQPTYVGFRLHLVSGPDRTDEDEGALVALASGLHDTTPTQLDPFDPPPRVVLSGPLRDAGRLEPATWYRWTVTVLAEAESGRGMFFFRTTETVPPGPPPGPTPRPLDLEPLEFPELPEPEPLEPTPAEPTT